jgi:hypothetical protein
MAGCIATFREAGRLEFPAPLLTLAALYDHDDCGRTLQALIVAGGGGHETRSGVPNALWFLPISAGSEDAGRGLELRFDHVPFYVYATNESDHWLVLVLTAASLEFLSISRGRVPALQQRYALAVPVPRGESSADAYQTSEGSPVQRPAVTGGRLRWRWAAVAGPWLAAFYEDDQDRIWLLHWPSACPYAAKGSIATNEGVQARLERCHEIALPAGFHYATENPETSLWACAQVAGIACFRSGAFSNDASHLALVGITRTDPVIENIHLSERGLFKETGYASKQSYDPRTDPRPCLVLWSLQHRPERRGDAAADRIKVDSLPTTSSANATLLDIPIPSKLCRSRRRRLARSLTPGPCAFLGTNALLTTMVDASGATWATLWQCLPPAPTAMRSNQWSLWRSWQLPGREPVTAIDVYEGCGLRSRTGSSGLLAMALANGTRRIDIFRLMDGCEPFLCSGMVPARLHRNEWWRHSPAAATRPKAPHLTHDLPASALALVPLRERAFGNIARDPRISAFTDWLLCSVSPDGSLVWLKLRHLLAQKLSRRALRFLFMYLIGISLTRWMLCASAAVGEKLTL